MLGKPFLGRDHEDAGQVGITALLWQDVSVANCPAPAAVLALFFCS